MDASVAISWVLADEFAQVTRQLLDRVVRQGATVPAIWPSEVLNALLLAERRGRIRGDEIVGCVETLGDLGIVVDATAWTVQAVGTAEIAQRFNLTAYDASYLQLAAREELPLASLDVRMRTAARSLNLELA